MPRPTDILRQHVLTRSDLAKLEVSPGDILDWLGDGWLEPIASPDAATSNDPIFTVSDRSLRQRLAPMLATIGKPTVVLTPLRVRSFLVRAMMQEHDQRPEPASPATSDDPANDRVLAVEPLPALDDASYIAQVAIEEAEQELSEVAAEAVAEPEAEAEAVADDASLADEDADGWFDSGDLASELDALDLFKPRDEVAEATTEEAFAEPPVEQPVEPSGEPLAEIAAAAAAEVSADELAETEDSTAEPTDDAEQPDLDLAEPPPDPTSSSETMTSNDEPTEPVSEDIVATPVADAVRPDVADEPSVAVAAAPANLPIPEVAAAPAAGPPVDSFLAEMQRALIDMANRPAPPAVDVQPIVAAVQAGFQQAAKSSIDTNAALSSLGEKIATLGVHREVAAAPTDSAGNPPVAIASPEFVVVEGRRSQQVLLAIGFLLLCWSALFWFKTGAPRLAISTLVGANLAGCCLLAGRR